MEPATLLGFHDLYEIGTALSVKSVRVLYVLSVKINHRCSYNLHQIMQHLQMSLDQVCEYFSSLNYRVNILLYTVRVFCAIFRSSNERFGLKFASNISLIYIEANLLKMNY